MAKKVEGALTAQKAFDSKTCGHTDFSPCLGDFGEPWLRYEVCMCDSFICVTLHTDFSPCLGDFCELWLRYEVFLCVT